MSSHDPVRLSKTMTFLLRHRPEVGELEPDENGFVEVEALCVAVSRLLRLEIVIGDVHRIVEHSDVRRFELRGAEIRASRSGASSRSVRSGGGASKVTPPDILYHACIQPQVQEYQDRGRLGRADGRAILLSDDESRAWRAAHRMGPDARVLYVDTARNRRRKLRLRRNRRSGLYTASSLSLADVLNLQPKFAEQLSAGGIPIMRGPDGLLRMALIRVTRRSGVTWEVAKGKLEPGEPPEWAGIREVQEEMGIDVDFEVNCLVGLIRYGFMAPGGLPRLKTVFLYLLDPLGEMTDDFSPSAREGIRDVRWFTPEEACQAVTHSSLVPIMHRAREMVRARYGGAQAPATEPPSNS